jgi:hypothetical protein
LELPLGRIQLPTEKKGLSAMCERTAFPTAARRLVQLASLSRSASKALARTVNRVSPFWANRPLDAPTLRDEGRIRARVNDVSALLGACDRRDRRN